MDSFTSLTGQLLVAMPSTRGDYFSQTVTLLIEHNQEGAFGLVVNRPIETDIWEILAGNGEFNFSKDFPAKVPLLETGPVERNRLFFLHSNDKQFSFSVPINENVSLSTSIDLLSAIDKKEGPKDVVAGLGYAGWSPGQLEHEIKGEAWLVTPYVHDAVFKMPYADRPQIAANVIGVNLALIAPVVGHG
mgnify:CR=1 FL=1